jgi:hypothetical protein
MKDCQYIIDIDEGRLPYNAYMVLPLKVLQKLAIPLRNEILAGLVDSDQEDKVILHLQLDKNKIKLVRKIIDSMRLTSEVVFK